MSLELRPLKASDAFTILNLVKRLDLIDPIKDLFTGDRRDELLSVVGQEDEELNEKQQTELGFEIFGDIVTLLVDRLPDNQTEICTLLADVYQTDVETIKELPIKEFIGYVTDFLQHKDFKELLAPIMEFEI